MIPAVLFLLGWAAAPPPASVEGRAVNAVSGDPLRGVHVRLVAMGSQGPKAAYGAISDQQGHFSMAAVAPGTYLWMPEFRGFVYAGKEPSLSLKPGRRVTDFRLEMTPQAVITGRVLDPSGDPVQFVFVQATPVNPEDVPLRPGIGSMSVMTDDRGEFRLRGAPGKYHIRANVRMMMSGALPELRVGGAPEPVYGDTWYPSTASAERAGVVEVASGADATGIDIHLVQNRSVIISGHVRGVPEGGTAMVRLATGGGPQSIENVYGSGTGPDGSFTFTRVQPGWHRLMAEASGARLHSRPMDLSVETDISGVELQIIPGGDLNGKLEIPGPAGRRTVRLEAVETLTMGQVPPATVDGEGAFEIHDIFPGRFRVNVEGLPEAACVASVSLDGTAAAGGVLDLSDPPRGGKLKITAVLDAAEVSGSVREGSGEPLNTVATVFLARDAVDLRPGNMIRTEDGTFTFKGVCPGRYRLVALTLLQRGISGLDDLKKLIAKAEEFEVKKGERLTRDVKVDAKKP